MVDRAARAVVALVQVERDVPARLPPAGALIVAESFGMNDCPDVIDDLVDVTTSVSLVQTLVAPLFLASPL